MCTRWTFKNGYFSLQSLLLTMKKGTKKDFESYPDVIECYSWVRFVLLQFIIEVVGIVNRCTIMLIKG